MLPEPDDHFLIDNASPQEVEYALRCLSSDVAYSTEELRERMLAGWAYSAQKDLNYSTRRLLDLGLSDRSKTALGKPGHILTVRGIKLKDVLDLDRRLYAELMHYLHYSSYDSQPTTRKLFWSYRQCCSILWASKRLLPDADIAAEVQARIASEFPQFYAQREGGNFNRGGVSSGWRPWIANLDPSPLVLQNDVRVLVPRQSGAFQLALLALDDVYRARQYRYGDPVILDDVLLDEIASVFFLDPPCCRQLIDAAARLTKAIRLADTFAGTSITLLEPYDIGRI